MLFRFKPSVLLLLLFTSVNLIAQTSEQKALEEKREQLQSEIRDINRLLFAEKKEKGNVLDHVMIAPPEKKLTAENTMPFEAILNDAETASEIRVQFTLD